MVHNNCNKFVNHQYCNNIIIHLLLLAQPPGAKHRRIDASDRKDGMQLEYYVVL